MNVEDSHSDDEDEQSTEDEAAYVPYQFKDPLRSPQDDEEDEDEEENAPSEEVRDTYCRNYRVD